MMARRVLVLSDSPGRAAVSPWAMVPSAPLMCPMWASSRTALSSDVARVGAGWCEVNLHDKVSFDTAQLIVRRLDTRSRRERESSKDGLHLRCGDWQPVQCGCSIERREQATSAAQGRGRADVPDVIHVDPALHQASDLDQSDAQETPGHGCGGWDL